MRTLPPRSPRPSVPAVRVTAQVVVAILIVSTLLLALAVLQAGMGMLALVAIIVAGMSGVKLFSHAGHALERHLLRRRMSQARASPVEELQEQLVLRSKQVERYRHAVSTLYAHIESMREMLEERQRVNPAHDVTKQGAALRKMAALHQTHVEKLDQAIDALAALRHHLELRRFEWSFAQAGQDALASLQSSDGEGVMGELLSDEASRAVQLNFHRVFAELDTDLREMRVEAVNAEAGDANTRRALWSGREPR